MYCSFLEAFNKCKIFFDTFKSPTLESVFIDFRLLYLTVSYINHIQMISQLIAGKPLNKVSFIKLEDHNDNRGTFTEIFKSEWSSCLEANQWSIVRSRAKTLRGMHLHHRHEEYFLLVEGHAVVGLKDLRPDSSTYNQHSLYQLFGKDPYAIIFPRGILHGWHFYTDSLHIQGVSEEYSAYKEDDNIGVKWDSVDIPWPFEEVILSEKAANFPTLSEL